jgi:hypothetical protein
MGKLSELVSVTWLAANPTPMSRIALPPLGKEMVGAAVGPGRRAVASASSGLLSLTGVWFPIIGTSFIRSRNSDRILHVGVFQ